MSRRFLLATLLLGTAAFAGDVRFNVNFGNWRLGNHRQTRAMMPYYPVQPYTYWIIYTPPAPAPPPAPPPQVIYVERDPEPASEPAPQVVVVQLPPFERPAPAPVAALPLVPTAATPAAPPAPRVPGPDVFLWTDDDGVVHYSTRVPDSARKRAKKLSRLAK